MSYQTIHKARFVTREQAYNITSKRDCFYFVLLIMDLLFYCSNARKLTGATMEATSIIKGFQGLYNTLSTSNPASSQ